MNVYSIDVKICATAYIKAESKEEAIRLAKEIFDEDMGGELPTGDYADIPVSGRHYNDGALPEISLSPAVTFYGPFVDGDEWSVDLVEKNVPSGKAEP